MGAVIFIIEQVPICGMPGMNDEWDLDPLSRKAVFTRGIEWTLHRGGICVTSPGGRERERVSSLSFAYHVTARHACLRKLGGQPIEAGAAYGEDRGGDFFAAGEIFLPSGNLAGLLWSHVFLATIAQRMEERHLSSMRNGPFARFLSAHAPAGDSVTFGGLPLSELPLMTDAVSPPCPTFLAVIWR